MYDVVIIGSGPAGLCASIYAKRAGLRAVTVERNFISGGQVVNTYEVDNYPGLPGINGFDMGMKFREHADKLGCEFQTATVQAIKKQQGKNQMLLQAASIESDKEQDNQGTFIVETDKGILETKCVLAKSFT